MSRATLYVRFPDGTLRYGLYDGTSDFAWSTLFASPGEAWADYGATDWTDDGESFPVDIATDYGGGSWWTGTATRLALTSGHDPSDADDGGSDLPSWARYPKSASGVSRVWHHPDGRMAKIKARDFPADPPSGVSR